MTLRMRPYQEQAVESSWEALQVHDSTLAVSPTGTGKTILFAELAKRFLPRGRIMVVAHREELLDQARGKIESVTGIYPDMEMGEETANEGFLKCPIVVSSVQSLNSRRNGVLRMHKFDPKQFSLLIIDEAHHAVSLTYKAVVDHFTSCNPSKLLNSKLLTHDRSTYKSNTLHHDDTSYKSTKSHESTHDRRVKVFGCTATPDRHDEEALGQVFESVAFEYGIRDAIDEGWLVPISQKFIECQIDFDGIKLTLGDFNGKELRELLAYGETLEKIASDSVQYAGDRRTLVFSDSVANAERLTINFNRHRMNSARLVTGETPKDERRAMITDYRAGGFQYLVNVGVAAEGFDVPEISCVVSARPTCSRSLYCQMVGRGTRPLPGVVDGPESDEARRQAIWSSVKQDALVVDIVGNSNKHKLVTCADILGGNYSEQQIATADKIIRESGVPVDVIDALEQAKERLHNEEIKRIAERAAKLDIKKQSKSREVDPFDTFGIAKRERRGWEPDAPANQEQMDKLEKWGITKDNANPSFSDAAQLIREFQSRTRRGLATYKQVKNLVRCWGMSPQQARETPFAEAGQIMTVLAANNWRKPVGVAV